MFASIGADVTGFKRGMGEVKSGLSQSQQQVAKFEAEFQRKMGGDFVRTLQNGQKSVRQLGTDFLQTARDAGLGGAQIEAAAGSMGIFSRGQLAAAKSSADLAIETDRLIHQMKNGEITAAQAGEQFGRLAANAQSGGININQMAAKFAAAAAVIGVAAMGINAAFDFARQGAELDYASVKFGRLAESAGSLSSVMLGDLRKATRGLYSDAELIGNAGNFMALGLAKSHDEAVRLATVAGALNMNMNQLVLTLTNQTTMRFDALGVSVDGFKERVDELKEAGLSAEEAFSEAFLQQAEAQIEKVGHAADTTLGSFMRLSAQGANAWDRLRIAAGKSLEPIADYLADNLEQTNRVKEAAERLGATFERNGRSALMKDWLWNINGELVTTQAMLRMATEEAARLANFVGREIETGGLEDLEGAALDVATALERLNGVNTNLASSIDSQIEKARLWALGIDNVDASMSNLVSQLMNGEISMFQFEGKARDFQVAAILAGVAAETIGDSDAQEQLEAYGLKLTQIKELLDLISSGKYSAELIVSVISDFGVAAGMQIVKDAGAGWQAVQNVGDQTGRYGHATGGRLGSKGPLVKVGEQGWEYAQYDPETGSWEIIPHNKSVQMEREKAAGMAGGGRLLDGVTSAQGVISAQRYNSEHMNLGGYYLGLGAQHPGAWHQNNPGVDTGWEQNNPNASWLQASAQQAAQVAQSAAAAAAQSAAVGVGASVAQQGQQQAERANALFVAEAQRLNNALVAEVRGMRQDIRNQPSKTDLKNAVLEAMSEMQ